MIANAALKRHTNGDANPINLLSFSIFTALYWLEKRLARLLLDDRPRQRRHRPLINFLSIYLTIYLSIHQSTDLSISLSIPNHLSIRLSLSCPPLGAQQTIITTPLSSMTFAALMSFLTFSRFSSVALRAILCYSSGAIVAVEGFWPKQVR